MRDQKWEQVKLYARDRFRGMLDVLVSKRIQDRNALAEDQLARGNGLLLDPLDPRFDNIEVESERAELMALAAAWLEAYDVYRLVPDDRLWRELCSAKEQSLAGKAMSLRQTATGRANRTGINSAPGIARAEALSENLQRAAHALLKLIHCEIEAKKQTAATRYGFGIASS